MDVSVPFQIITSAAAMSAGFLLGCFRLCLGLTVSVFGRNRIVTAICDILSFSFASFVTYCIFLVFTYGNIRGFILAFELIGLIAYLLTVGRIKNKVEERIFLKSKSIKYKIKKSLKKLQKNRKKHLQDN